MKLYEQLQYTLEIKKMSNICDFDRILKNFNISPETTELITWMTLKEMRQTRICGEQDF